MALEAGSFIEDLVIANPPGSDGKSQGDDHLRLLKTVIKATFPLAIAARKFRNDDAGATDTLAWTLYRKSATPAANDLLASFLITGDSSTAVERAYARFQGQIISPTNAAEEGAALIKIMSAGVETQAAKFQTTGTLFAFPLTGAGKPPTFQQFTATALWTRPAGCRYVICEGVGGGGGSGGVDGQGSGTSGSTGGGGSGFSGRTGMIDVSGDASRTVTVGNGGTAGAAAAGSGGSGTVTAITLNGTQWRWEGGEGSPGYTANESQTGTSEGGLGGVFNNVIGCSDNGTMGVSQADAGGGNVTGGNGGSGNFGRGGQGSHGSVSAASVGGTPNAFGGGGGGSVVCNSSTNVAGRAGADGIMRIWEFY